MLGWFKRNRGDEQPPEAADPVTAALSAKRLGQLAAAHIGPHEPPPQAPSGPVLLLAPPNYRREIIGWIDLSPAARFEVSSSSRWFRRG